MRKTKIVCTLGPATDSYQAVKKLIKHGMNVARINMSHGSYDEHSRRIDLVKRAREELSLPVAILIDTKGPEIRIKDFESGKAILSEGDYFTLTTENTIGNNARVAVTYKPLPEKVTEGDSILIDDGKIELSVVSKTKKEIVCSVVNGGILTSRKSINVPGIDLDMPYVSEIDRQDIEFGIKENADYFALSFVRCAGDVRDVISILEKNGAKDIQLIAKIENRAGVDNIEEILSISDGVMVARGDMGVEIPFEELPGIQKKLIKMCYQSGKKVITATQMLESMITCPRPTRAEISDVANAIYDGSSAIMLSGETAVGAYPFDAVKTMAKIAERTEGDIHYNKRFKLSDAKIKTTTDAISHSTVAASYDLAAKAIIAVSRSGYTVRNVSRFRPECVIVGATTSPKAYNQLALNWGVLPVMADEQPSSDALFAHSIEVAKAAGVIKSGDTVVIAAGVPVGKSGTTNTMKIEKVE